MVGQAHAPLVSGDRKQRAATVWWLMALSSGFLLGAGTVMMLAWGAGTLAGTSGVAWRTRALILLAALAVLVAFDLVAAVHGRSIPLGVRRQTPKNWNLRFRGDVTALLWGMDIGTGVSTYRMTSAIWLGLLAVFLKVIPVGVGLLYGVVSATAISMFVTFIGGGAALQPWLPRLLRARRPVQLAYVASALAVAATTIAQAQLF
ncbi:MULTISPECIES: hypothetical protein [unclassified Streptomyces]|uniref:hypothetical protein n=1 Tax=unclassified Streptomyces TaxID=2593676 RepID=UPI002E1812FA